MITLNEVSSAIYGAWRLAHFDPRGMVHFDLSPGGFWRSFFAAVIVLPAEIILLVVVMLQGDAATLQAAPLWRVVAIWAIAYVIGWAAFPLVMVGIADALDRRERFIGFIVAANWSTTVQAVVIVPAVIVSISGGFAGFLLYVAVQVAVFAYAWFITKTALDIGGFPAAGVVMLSFVIELVIAGSSDVLIARS